VLSGSGLVDIAREGGLGAEDVGSSVDVVDSAEEGVPKRLSRSVQLFRWSVCP
jgi:hypothetical protein